LNTIGPFVEAKRESVHAVAGALNHQGTAVSDDGAQIEML
jgi:hypothetical protein